MTYYIFLIALKQQMNLKTDGTTTTTTTTTTTMMHL
jgi:hypothetical protein